MRFDLREEAINEFLGNIAKYTEELHTNNMVLQKQLNEVLSQTQYEMLQKLMDEVIRNYNENVVDASKGILVEWCDSENSLKSIMHHYKVGEQAEKTCSDLDNKVIEKFSQDLNMISLEYQKPERPKVSKEDFERVRLTFQQYEKGLEETYSVFRSKIKELTKENEIYLCVPALVSLLQKKNVEFVEFAKERIGKLEAHIEEELMTFNSNELDVDEKAGRDNQNKTGDSDNTSALPVISPSSKDIYSCPASMKKRLLKIFNSDQNNINIFKELTKCLYDLLIDGKLGKKELPLMVLHNLTPIYEELYMKFGQWLKYTANENDIEAFVEYVNKYDLVSFFENEEMLRIFLNAAEHQTFDGYHVVAKELNNVAEAYLKAKAEHWQVYYSGTILLYPVIYGRAQGNDVVAYETFCVNASEKFLQTFNIELPKKEKNSGVNGEENKKTQEDIDKITKVVEDILNNYGIDKINSTISEMREEVRTLIDLYSSKEFQQPECKSEKKESKKSKYGRYNVTEQAIYEMEPICEYYNSLIAPIDNFLKDIMGKRERRYNKLIDLSKCVNETADAILKWIQGVDNDTNGNILANVIGKSIGIADAKGISGIFNVLLPQLKKNKILANVSTVFWTITDKSVKNADPYLYRYVFDHYNIKYHNIDYQACECWRDLHSVTYNIDDETQRRIVENAYMATWYVFYRTDKLNRVIDTSKSEKEIQNIRAGVWLNCIRAGMCEEERISSEKANELVDRLYNLYRLEDAVKPKVEVTLF